MTLAGVSLTKRGKKKDPNQHSRSELDLQILSSKENADPGENPGVGIVSWQSLPSSVYSGTRMV